MKEYVKPDVEVILFENEVFTGTSVCNCHYDINSNTLSIGGVQPECEAETGGAGENPFGVDVPQWTFVESFILGGKKCQSV